MRYPQIRCSRTVLESPTFGRSEGHAIFDSSGRYVFEFNSSTSPNLRQTIELLERRKKTRLSCRIPLLTLVPYTVNEADRSFTLHIESSRFRIGLN